MRILAYILIALAIVAGIVVLLNPCLDCGGRDQMNEASAIASLRSLNTSIVAYQQAYPKEAPCGLERLGPNPRSTAVDAAHAGFISSVLASGEKSGYNFQFVSCWNKPEVKYWITASPKQPGVTGNRYFCSKEDAVIRWSRVGANDCVLRGQPLQ